MKFKSAPPESYEYQAEAALVQAAPVQDTWYTILDTVVKAKLYLIVIRVLTTGEDIGCRITIDGVVYGNSASNIITAAASAVKYCYISTAGWMNYATTSINLTAYTALEGKRIKVEMVKRTANGAGDLEGWVLYGKLKP